MEYKNILYEIFIKLSNVPMVDVEFTAANQVVAIVKEE
ncbi:hypothetical protein BCQ_1342 [Bacillus cereus Q1]|uniref:Uncharacterized protein n=1 Tax=Bacillus cereus (strain Q1) TaxID=361100 RepID=B9IU75_BACCQ|nr:hypothetical protein BCQ_1342 [Bacillus cereus Q1]